MFGARYSNGFLALFVWTTFLTQTTTIVQAQINGTCVCQPGAFQFTLDFALGCDNRTILSGLPGIEDAVCAVTTADSSIAVDNVPVSVSVITVTEIGINLEPIKTENITFPGSTYQSGDIFAYEAFSMSDVESVANGTIPIGLQVSITGRNANDEEIINKIVVIFTNDCAIYPVLDAGSTIGWVSLVCNPNRSQGNRFLSLHFS